MKIIDMVKKISSFLNQKILIIFLKIIPLVVILTYFLIARLEVLEIPGRDHGTYQYAIEKFIEGGNVYRKTIVTYENQEFYSGDLGFSYLSGFLYLYGALYSISLYFELNEHVVYKIPNLLADVGVGLIIYIILSKKSYFYGLFGFLVWLINPYMLIKNSYTYNDIIPVFLMLIAFIYMKKDSVITGTFFALSVIFKTFPLIFLPLFLLETKEKQKFLLAAFIVGVASSLPFMKNLEYFIDYIRGSLLVHGSRDIQGRPFLFYFSYWFDIELIQVIPHKIYSFLAMFGSWAIILFFYYYFKIKDIYILGSLAALNFYIFTPVLNRTYLLWFFPVFILGAYKLGLKKNYYLFYIVLGSFYALYYFYLKDWGLGFHEIIPF